LFYTDRNINESVRILIQAANEFLSEHSYSRN